MVQSSTDYHRYHIEARNTPGIANWPPLFCVEVGKIGLANHLIKELIHARLNMEVALSRPCIYGVFSGPIGGFAPRPKYCVACLRCMNEYPEFVRISPNPAHWKLGDSYFTSDYVDQLTYEAETGMVPVKGAGYRGKFGGEGWDGMWTDMSEIVRPTRDGIYGREFISTSVDIGTKPNFFWSLAKRAKLVIEYSTAADVPEEWTDRTYTYSLSQPHAVIADSTGSTYGYDSNGNMTSRVEGGRHYQQSYNAEHQLSQVALWNNQTLLATWNFIYDGDGSPSTGSGQAG